MVVGDFNLHRALIGPAETHAPLIVDANAVLAIPVAAQRFEAMRRRKPEISQLSRCHDPLNPHTRPSLDGGRQAADRQPVQDALNVFVPEPLHVPMITLDVSNVKGY